MAYRVRPHRDHQAGSSQWGHFGADHWVEGRPTEEGQGEEQGGQDGKGQPPTGKAGERFKVACGCQPPRSFWIRAKQYTPGPISSGVCGQDFQPQDAGHQ